ncbi:hypothetical protein GCM10017567_21970 [Amycolatopsis bullii]|uniref:Uncharacterized protein n=1 Tax=Amycolatopsis bullii TaxID=941987 RepID=A0ABQ3K8D3_9PSEU|nr:hypothetical protein GCM10017567_21970 [Amycolatopsis bullii]
MIHVHRDIVSAPGVAVAQFRCPARRLPVEQAAGPAPGPPRPARGDNRGFAPGRGLRHPDPHKKWVK